MVKLAKAFWTDDSGQGLAEYALLLGLIVAVSVHIIGVLLVMALLVAPSIYHGTNPAKSKTP